MARSPGRTTRGLGARLRDVRHAAGLSGIELARRLGPGWRQSRISKIETGQQLPTRDELQAWADATGSDVGQLLALLDKATAEYATWRGHIQDAGGVVATQEQIGALEVSCEYLAGYQPTVIHGRLQTAAYARATVDADEFLADDLGGPDEVARLVAARIRRQSILYEPGRRIVHVLGEAALRIRFGGLTLAAMRGQLEHLVETIDVPGHELGIVPLGVEWPIPPAPGFDMYDRDLVVIEALTGDLQITDPVMTARYARWVDQLLEVSLTGGDAAEFIRQVTADSRPLLE